MRMRWKMMKKRSKMIKKGHDIKTPSPCLFVSVIKNNVHHSVPLNSLYKYLKRKLLSIQVLFMMQFFLLFCTCLNEANLSPKVGKWSSINRVYLLLL